MNDFRKVLDTPYYTYYTVEQGDTFFMGKNKQRFHELINN